MKDRKRQTAEQNTSATFHTTAFYMMLSRQTNSLIPRAHPVHISLPARDTESDLALGLVLGLGLRLIDTQC